MFTLLPWRPGCGTGQWGFMRVGSIEALAELAGISPGYDRHDGTFVPTTARTRDHLLHELGLPADAENLAEALEGLEPARLAVSGGHRCHLPDWLLERPAWGIACQLHELRSERSWGIGDFADLAEFCRIAASRGADFVGVTPLHALFTADPRRCSPFSPSNRRFLDPLLIAVDQVPGHLPGDVATAELAALQRGDLVNHEAVATVKLTALRRAWHRWPDGSAEDHGAFDAFRRQRGEALRLHALFEAISHRMVQEGHGAGFADWPMQFQDPTSQAVAALGAALAGEIAFHAWLQWLADRQLAWAGEAALQASMRIGLYLDLAVGEAPDGSAVWGSRDIFMSGVGAGAPPDYFSQGGQGWGVAALSPRALQQQDFRPFEDLIGDASAHAGALRLDHVMGLWQLFLIPDDATPAEGAHLRYPFGSMLERLSRLSHERSLVVIGEDLGHVPEGFREVMQEARILSYRILFFEKRDDGSFLPPEDYPRNAIACLSTHDLPTFRGWWRGDDIPLRLEHGLIDEQAASTQQEERTRERGHLLKAVHASGSETREPSNDLVVAVHRLLAATPSLLVAVRLADLLGEDRPANVPGTVDSYPNWRRRSSVPLEGLADHPLFCRITAEMARSRPRA